MTSSLPTPGRPASHDPDGVDTGAEPRVVSASGAAQSEASKPLGRVQSVLHSSAAASIELRDGRYVVRLARTTSEVEAALRLRYEIFNLELGEGLASSVATGMDRDEFDSHCDHLLLLDTEDDDRVIGTYRVQTEAMAAAGAGFYCDREYHLEQLPANVLERSIEIGRACVALPHRNGSALLLLWRGVIAYLSSERCRYVFGCCSLTSRDMRDGLIAKASLASRSFVDADLAVDVRAALRCDGEPATAAEIDAFKLPKLFATYLRYRCKVISEPAIDREFGTVDFLVLFDIEKSDPRFLRLLTEG